MLRVATALAAALVCLMAGGAAPAAQGGGVSQLVKGSVTAQLGFAVDSAGRVSPSATTIPAAVTRKRVDGVEIVTIIPLR
jgi:hypothetical protein